MQKEDLNAVMEIAKIVFKQILAQVQEMVGETDEEKGLEFEITFSWSQEKMIEDMRAGKMPKFGRGKTVLNEKPPELFFQLLSKMKTSDYGVIPISLHLMPKKEGRIQINLIEPVSKEPDWVDVCKHLSLLIALEDMGNKSQTEKGENS